MHKIGVIGDRESVRGFMVLGLDTVPVKDEHEASETLKKMVKSGEYGILFVTEQVIAMISDEINRYRSLSIPAIIPIPGNKGTEGIGMDWVKDSVVKAIGADIL